MKNRLKTRAPGANTNIVFAPGAGIIFERGVLYVKNK